MGFFDNVSAAVNRGTSSVQRTGRTAQLKMQMTDLMKQRRDLAAQLGASLYDTVKDMPEMRVGREPIFKSIEDIDKQRADIEAEIARIEAAAVAQQEATTMFRCPNCGSEVAASDLFCSGCGKPISEVKASSPQPEPEAASGLKCISCGAPLNEGDVFCMACGTKQEAAPASETGNSAEAVPES